MKYQFAIFDMDGTLLDSMHYWKNLARDYLISKGLPAPEDLREQLKTRTLEEGAAYFKEMYGMSETAEEIVEELYATIADNYRYRVVEKPGALAFLAQLKARGVKMCVATATFDYVAKLALERLGFMEYLEFVMDCREAGGKTSPAVYDQAAARLGGDRTDTVVFEDALHAIRTAHDAGYFVAAVREKAMSSSEAAIREASDIYIEDYRAADLDDWWH